MIGALLSFCALAVGGRELSGSVPVLQTLFVRSVVGLLILGCVAVLFKQPAQLKTQRLGLHTVRNVFHYIGQYGWFLGLGLLPLAEVFAIEFTVPIWTLIIATLFLGETLTKHKIIALVLGMVGVLIIVRPGYEMMDKAAWIVLMAAVGYALSHSATKALSNTETPFNIVFYMCLIQLPIGFVLAFNHWVQPNVIDCAWLALVSVTALTAHYCMSKALQYAEVSAVVVMDFMRLPLIILVGVLVYSEPFDVYLMVGAAFMLVGNLISMRGST